MMNKIKSGKVAKLKALLALPVIIAAFFVFANMSFSNQSSLATEAGTDYVDSQKIKHPKSEYFMDIDLETVPMQIVFDGNVFTINGEQYSIAELSEAISNEKTKCADTYRCMASLEIDESAKMKEVEALLYTLRKNEVYKIAYIIDPVSNIGQKGKTYVRYQKLPPLEAKLLDKSEMKAEGIEVFSKNTGEKGFSKQNFENELKTFISSTKKRVIIIKYDNSTTYDEYNAYVDAVFVTFYNLRNDYSLKNYQKNFNDLTDKQQKEIAEMYPITLMAFLE